MIVAHFLRWIETARVADRAAAASALARAFVNAELPFEDRCAAEAALSLLLDDPSCKVRQAMADALSLSRHAPAQVISALASDQPEVAAIVLGRSPLLSDSDLIDRVALGESWVQELIAQRAEVTMPVSAALAETGSAEACRKLVANVSAQIAGVSLKRITERYGADAQVRELLLRRVNLPADARHMLVERVVAALKASPFVVASIGAARAERVTRDAGARAALALVELTDAGEYGALVEHLRLRRELTPAFIVRLVACGRIDFFAVAVAFLSGQPAHRVASLLAGGRHGGISALLRKTGLSPQLDRPILAALDLWRDVVRGRHMAGVQEATWLMLNAIETTASGQSEASAEGRALAALLRSIHLDELRANARGHALEIAAA